MLKNIIIPEKIGNYFIYPKRILGFDLGKAHVSATQIYVSGKRLVKIEKYFEENISTSENVSYKEKAANSIRNILNKSDKYDNIKVALPSYLVIFKELTLPFVDISKIRSILDFEIEPVLPFSIDQAVADFIITKQDSKTKETTIFVAVARKKDIQELIEPFIIAGVQPNNITVDIIGLYGLLKTLPSYSIDNSEGTVLLDIEYNYTNIAYIQDGQLKIIRSIHQGISNIATNLATSSNIDYENALEQLNKFGIEEKGNNEYKQKIEKVMTDFINNIAFTLNSFKTLLPLFSQIKKLILIGKWTQIKGLPKFCSEQLNIPHEVITIKSILQNSNIQSNKDLPNSAITSLATAYPSENNESFNLLRKDLETYDFSLLKKQFFVAGSLLLSLLAILFFFSFTQARKLKNEINASKSQVINKLKNTFEITDPAILKNLSEVINTANNKVNEESDIWFSFSSQARFSFLKYLQELSSIIDRDGIGLNLKSLSIAQGIITLEGEVKDFKALESLENELNQSKLFSHVSVPQETRFTIKMTIKKNEEIEQ